MKKVEKLLNWAKEARKIFKDSGETDFEELRKREKTAIFSAFENCGLKIEYDGDSDGVCAYKEFESNVAGHIEVTFYSSCYDIDDFEKKLSGLKCEINEKEYDSGWDKSDLTFDEFVSLLEECVNKETEKAKSKKIALLNTSIITTAGSYVLTDITLDKASDLIAENADNLDSAIGHQSTAEIMTTLLRQDIQVNRQMFVQEVGQTALVFKLNGRPEEGKVLTVDEIEKIGYKFQTLIRTE